MTQQHGRRHEHDLNNGLNQVTTNDVWCTTAGFSGNAASDNCDIVVTVSPTYAAAEDPLQYNHEAKKITSGKSGNRSMLFQGSSSGETGVGEVKRLVESTPDWAQPVITAKFSHRKLVVIDARGLLAALGEYDWPVSETVKMLAPRSTKTGNVSVVMPTLDDWESSTAAPRDAVVLAQTLGLPIKTEYES